MNDIPLTARRPFVKNALFLLGFLAAETVLLVFYLVFRNPSPVTIAQRFGESVFFCVFLIGSLFLVLAAAHCARNLFSPPTFLLDNEKLYITGYQTAELSAITGMDLSENKLVIRLSGGEELCLRQKDVNLPLSTLRYSIDVRLEQKGLCHD